MSRGALKTCKTCPRGFFTSNPSLVAISGAHFGAMSGHVPPEAQIENLRFWDKKSKSDQNLFFEVFWPFEWVEELWKRAERVRDAFSRQIWVWYAFPPPILGEVGINYAQQPQEENFKLWKWNLKILKSEKNILFKSKQREGFPDPLGPTWAKQTLQTGPGSSKIERLWRVSAAAYLIIFQSPEQKRKSNRENNRFFLFK